MEKRMKTDKRDFNKEAAQWDQNPGRLKLAESVFKAIKSHPGLSKNMNVMDFGCGTGLLSLHILPLVKSVTGIDSSTGMLEVLNSKIEIQKLSGIKTIYIDIDKGDRLAGEYDLITCSMTMHHIKDPSSLIEQFYDIVRPGGYLCIADLDPDSGLFHEKNDGVFHFGFSRDDVKKHMKNAGFSETFDSTAAEIKKPGVDGNINTFTVFLVTAKK